MTAHDPGALGRNLHLFEVQGIVFSSLDLDHEIEGNPTLSVENDLICLAGLHPNHPAPPHGGMHIRLKIAPDNPPAVRQGKDQKVAGPE